ncbi:MAG: metal ABC transporter ATP-binding protein [Candidatus Heimdallarchaeota archaeon]|nr:metal ABC transporter ATP-binding protein [Candidatus Heimdallarchaeota archaeon]
MNKIISVQNVTVSFHQIPALWNISFEVERGEMIAIIGPNGAGKSTLLKSMLNLNPIKKGSILIKGEAHHKLNNRHKILTYMPQRSSLDWDFPINVLDVVVMGRYGHIGWFRRPGKKDKEDAYKALEKFGMEKYADKQIGELSGGQKQRVLLARAYIQDADIYFLDEPFGGVDTITEETTLNLLRELKSNNKTILVVTHDLHSLKEYFDKVLLLNTQKVAFGNTDDILTEDNLKQAYGGLMHMAH